MGKGGKYISTNLKAMIKATELQIGNFVLVDGKPCRVESITRKKIGYHLYPQTDKGLYYARLHDVEPILITRDFMDKNFVHVANGLDDSIIYTDFNRQLFYKKPIVCIPCHQEMFEIKWVHELQRLYSMMSDVRLLI